MQIIFQLESFYLSLKNLDLSYLKELSSENLTKSLFLNNIIKREFIEVL